MTTATDIPPLRCMAHIGQEPTPFGFRFVRCGQVVAVRGFWAKTAAWENTDNFVAYCSLPGHQANVRRRFEARTDVPDPHREPPEPCWLHEDPGYDDRDYDGWPDDLTYAKWTADREESWTAT